MTAWLYRGPLLRVQVRERNRTLPRIDLLKINLSGRIEPSLLGGFIGQDHGVALIRNGPPVFIPQMEADPRLFLSAWLAFVRTGRRFLFLFLWFRRGGRGSRAAARSNAKLPVRPNQDEGAAPELLFQPRQ